MHLMPGITEFMQKNLISLPANFTLLPKGVVLKKFKFYLIFNNLDVIESNHRWKKFHPSPLSTPSACPIWCETYSGNNINFVPLDHVYTNIHGRHYEGAEGLLLPKRPRNFASVRRPAMPLVFIPLIIFLINTGRCIRYQHTSLTVTREFSANVLYQMVCFQGEQP